MNEDRLTKDSDSPAYEPPQVERVLDRDELSRENFYAGAVFSCDPCGVG